MKGIVSVLELFNITGSNTIPYSQPHRIDEKITTTQLTRGIYCVKIIHYD